MASFEERTNAEIMTKLVAAGISFHARYIGTEPPSMAFDIENKNLRPNQFTTIGELGGSSGNDGMMTLIIGLPVSERDS